MSLSPGSSVLSPMVHCLRSEPAAGIQPERACTQQTRLIRQGRNKWAQVIPPFHNGARATPEYRKQVELRFLWDVWAPPPCSILFSPCAAQQGPLLIVVKALEKYVYCWSSLALCFCSFSKFLTSCKNWTQKLSLLKVNKVKFSSNELRKHTVHPKYLARTVQYMYIKTISNFLTQKKMLALAAVQKEL